MDPEPGRLDVFRTAARNRLLLRVGVAFMAFNGAETGVWIAILVWAFSSGGATAASALALVQLIPSAALAPWLGALADRHRPGRILLGSYVAMAAAGAALSAVVAVGGPDVLVYAFALAMNLAVTAVRPAQAALLPGIVTSAEELAASNAGQGALESTSGLVAPLLTALLLAVGGPELGIAGMAALAAVGALVVAGIPGAPPLAGADEEDAQDATAGVIAGLRAIAADSATRSLVGALGLQYVLIGALDLLFVVLAFDVLGMGQSGAGLLTAAFGAGGLLALGVTALLVGRPRLAPALALSGTMIAGALMVLAVYPTVATALLLVALAGLARSVFDVTGRTLLQRIASPGILASVFGALESLLCAGLALGFLIAPILVSAGGATVALAGTGAILLVALGLLLPQLWRLDAAATVPLVELRLLQSIEVFARLPAPALETVARALSPLTVRAGATVIREGDPGDRYYAIARGVLRVTREGRQIAERGRGEGVGEIALINDEPRTATVVAVGDADLYALEREPFLLAVTGHASARTTAERLVHERRGELAQAARQA